jgi:hypothetical protein
MNNRMLTNKKLRCFVAKTVPKWIRSPVYKKLYKSYGHEYAISGTDFCKKSVLIVGPARTGPLELEALDVSRFDIVVKFNNGIFVPNEAFEDSNRCDILFHSLTRDTKPVTSALVAKCGVKTIVHRLTKRNNFLKTLIEEERFEGVAELKVIPYTDYESLSAQLGGYSPTTGLTCANFFLNSQAFEVAIVGFTFFSTRYVAGYDDSVETDDGSYTRVVTAGHHSPRQEARLMQSLIKAAEERRMHVVIGSRMREAMQTVAGRI